MKKKKKNLAGRVATFLVLAMVAAMMLFVFGGRVDLMLKGTVVQATVVGAEDRPYTDDDGYESTRTYYELAWEYGGQTYSRKTRQSGGLLMMNFFRSDYSGSKTLAVGKVVDIYIDPANPATYALVDGVHNGVAATLLFLAIPVGMLLLTLPLKLAMGRRQAAQPGAGAGSPPPPPQADTLYSPAPPQQPRQYAPQPLSGPGVQPPPPVQRQYAPAPPPVQPGGNATQPPGAGTTAQL